MTADYTAIVARATDDERAEIDLLKVAVERTRAAYESGFGKEQLEDWQAAKAALAAAVDSVSERLTPTAPPIKNKLAAVKLLKAEGWRVQKTKLYADAKAGLLAVQEDGSILRADLDSYVLRAGLEKTAGAGGRIEKDQAEIKAQELIRIKKKNERLEWEFDKDRGRYLLKDDVRTELALKLGGLESGLKHFIRTEAADLIYAVGGDAAKSQVLINLFEARLDEQLDAFGRIEELNIVVVKGGSAGGDAEQSAPV